jgi:hypothetical protein
MNHRPGPPEAWQAYRGQWASDVPPLTRLSRAGAAGLAVATRRHGGLSRRTAGILRQRGLALVDDAAGRAYACQLALPL